jgi:hypothetical protein
VSRSHLQNEFGLTQIVIVAALKSPDLKHGKPADEGRLFPDVRFPTSCFK